MDTEDIAALNTNNDHIRAINLSKHYDSKSTVLNSISINIPKGQM